MRHFLKTSSLWGESNPAFLSIILSQGFNGSFFDSSMSTVVLCDWVSQPANCSRNVDFQNAPIFMEIWRCPLAVHVHVYLKLPEGRFGVVSITGTGSPADECGSGDRRGSSIGADNESIGHGLPQRSLGSGD